MENTENKEATPTVAETPATKTVSVDLTAEQYAFLTGWQKTHEKELGIEVPIGALVRKTVEAAMNAAQRPARDDKPSFGGDRGAPRRDGPGGRPAGRPSFGGGDRPDRGGRPSFGGDRGGRPSFGGGDRGRPAGRGPKFDMLSKGKPRRFDS